MPSNAGSQPSVSPSRTSSSWERRSISSTWESTARRGASARSELERLGVAGLLDRRPAELLRDQALAAEGMVLEDADREHGEVERPERGRRPAVRLVHRDEDALALALEQEGVRVLGGERHRA